MTPQGLLIPRAALQGWGEVQVVREDHRIVIRPKILPPDRERELVAQALRETGLFYEPEQEPDLPGVLDEERAELAEKLNVGRSLLESVVEGRDERA
jgi:hypothetical protein